MKYIGLYPQLPLYKGHWSELFHPIYFTGVWWANQRLRRATFQQRRSLRPQHRVAYPLKINGSKRTFPINKRNDMLTIISLLPQDHWTLKTGYFEDPNPAIQVQTLPLEGPRSLGRIITSLYLPSPKTNVAPARKPSQKGNNHIPTIHFQVQAVFFSGRVMILNVFLCVFSHILMKNLVSLLLFRGDLLVFREGYY